MVKWLKRMVARRKRRKYINMPDHGVIVIGSNVHGGPVWYAAMDEETAHKGFDELGGVHVNEVRRPPL